MSLPQLMFPGFLSENLQQWVQCTHRRYTKPYPPNLFHVCMLIYCTAHTDNFIIRACYRPALYIKIPPPKTIHVPFFPCWIIQKSTNISFLIYIFCWFGAKSQRGHFVKTIFLFVVLLHPLWHNKDDKDSDLTNFVSWDHRIHIYICDRSLFNQLPILCL